MLSASLTFADQRSSQLFQLHPEALHFDRSCRFFRRFGSQRFLRVTLPSFERSGMPDYLALHQSSLHKRLREWLATRAKSFLGCSWDVMYVKPRKDKPKSASSAGNRTAITKAYDVTLSAIEGPGLQPVSMWELLDWFLPFRLNTGLLACKAFARIELGMRSFERNGGALTPPLPQ